MIFARYKLRFLDHRVDQTVRYCFFWFHPVDTLKVSFDFGELLTSVLGKDFRQHFLNLQCLFQVNLHVSHLTART